VQMILNKNKQRQRQRQRQRQQQRQQQQQQQQQNQNQDNNEEEGTTTTIVKTKSMLTLSEDHAYERHTITAIVYNTNKVNKSASATSTSTASSTEAKQQQVVITTTKEGTCEVAIPGSTKKDKSKRGCDIADTFIGKKNSKILKPESSWLYMSNTPVICDTLIMGLVHIIGNINCNINPRNNNNNKKSSSSIMADGSTGSSGSSSSSSSSSSKSLESRQLYKFKRELLWMLYDLNGMEKCPFGYMELGDCEQTVESSRGNEVVEINIKSRPKLLKLCEELYDDFGLNDNECLMNEVLLLEAIAISREIYNDRQVYPYYYLGHYHKDAGKNSNKNSNLSSGGSDDVDKDEPEHQFVYAIRMYVEAIRVTATYYRYDIDDCKQLNKHITTVTQYIYEDILHDRKWNNTSNAILCCYWLFKFIDLLFYYEEYTLLQNDNAGIHTNNQHFVDTLQLKHKFSFVKLIQSFDYESVRQHALNRLLTEQEKYSNEKQQQQRQKAVDETATTPTSSTSSTNVTTPPTRPFRSKRMETLVLSKKLLKNSLKIVDMDLVIILDDDTNDNERNENNGGRSQRKRRRR
ncbi:MAG: hypothetical protein ACI90V_011572, partial [Bacillariaceae sp.]